MKKALELAVDLICEKYGPAERETENTLVFTPHDLLAKLYPKSSPTEDVINDLVENLQGKGFKMTLKKEYKDLSFVFMLDPK